MKNRLLPTAIASAVTLVLLLTAWAHPAAPPKSGTKETFTIEPEPRHGCTAFSLDNNGYAVLGKNKDSTFVDGIVVVNKRNVAKSGFESSTTGEYALWTSKYGSVTFNHAGYQLASDGMNEAGLMISTHYLAGTENPAPDERPPILSAVWAQYVLDNFSTVEEVLASESEVRISDTEDHYLVCDRTGECAAIEFLGGEMVYHTGDTLPVKVLSNNTYEESLEAWQEKAREELGELWDFSLVRFVIAADRVTSFEPTSAASAVDYAFDTLAQTSQELVGGSSTTAWSMVFDTENMQVHFRTHTNPHIRTIDFGKLDFSCDSPTQMLDVHADLSGDISHHLPEYSHRANLEHMFKHIEHFNSDISPMLVRVLVRGTESFPCVQDAGALPYPRDGRSSLPPMVIWLGLNALKRLLLVWVPLVLGSLAFLIWDLAHRTQASWGMRVVWGLVVVLFGPFGLLIYWLAHRKRQRVPELAGASS